MNLSTHCEYSPRYNNGILIVEPMGTIPTGNTPGKSSYANITGKPSVKKVNVRTLFTPGGNGIDVVVLVDSIHAISKRFSNTAYGFFLGNKVAYLVVANYVRNTWGKYGVVRSMFSSSTGLFSFKFSFVDGLDVMLENGPWFIQTNSLILKKWHPYENLLNEDGRSSYARIIIELQADVELKDNIVMAMPKITKDDHYTCVGEKKIMKKPSQTSRGVPVGLKMSFKPQKEYRPVPKKPNASSSGNKKKGLLLSSFMSANNDREFVSNTPIVPTGIVQSDSEVEVVFDETANLRISMSGKDGRDKGYGTNSLLEQWRDSYPNNDDYDPYDDDMYENHDFSEHLQSIYDDLDITIHGRKKK
nr:hypothetical protein [Tanacetum cinerariifolium]